MIITYGGIEAFKVQFGDIVLAFNPISKDSKHKTARFGADVAFVTLNHPDMNGVDTIGFGEKKPFVVSGPGEYETKDIFIKGFLGESEYGGKKQINTIYTVTLEGMNLAFLGALSSTELSPDANEALGETDILFVPIGGEGVFDAANAYKFAVKLEPKLIIPMHYGDIGAKDALKIFLKEGGAEDVKPEEKLTLKRKDLEGKEAEIFVLSPTNA